MSETPPAADDELIRFLSASAPRVVPVSIKHGALKAHASRTGVFVGVFLILFGSIFVWLFLPWRQADEWRLAASDPARTPGHITGVEPTHMSINHQRVMAYTFRFKPAQGPEITGACFTTGKRWQTGATIMVRYAPGNPALACPEGARLSESSLGASFVLLFPLAGVVVAVWTVRARRRTCWLLENGTLGDFRVTTIEATGTKINNHTQFKISLQRLDQTDAKPHEVRWYKPALVAFARERQESGQAVFGLFDPAKPKKVLLPEAWSASG